MTPQEPAEMALEIAVLKTEVANLKDGHRELTNDIKDLSSKVERLADRLNTFMVKTAVATAGLTAAGQAAVNYWGA